MKKYIIMLLIIVVMLPGCSQNDILPTTTPQPSDTAFPTATPTILPTKTPTLTPTPTATPDPVLESLKAVMASEYWQTLGLPAEQMAKWQAYAAESAQLSNSELVTLQDFLAQWDKWNGWLTSARIPSYEKLAFKVRALDNSQGEENLVLYAIDEIATQKEGAERLYLAIPENPEKLYIYKIKALILAPKIEGMRQEVSENGESVDYIDEKDNLFMYVDAFRSENSLFHDFVKGRYGGSYNQAGLYPRFHFFIPGIESGFYLLDKNLTLQQIIFLKEILDIFSTPIFKTLVPYFFSDKRSYVIVTDIERLSGNFAAGLANAHFTVLDRHYLFENKNELASAIAHESTHDMFGAWRGCSAEIGDGTIPEDLYNWSADDLLAAIKDHKIGTTHVDLWMHIKLKSAAKVISFYRERIETKGQYEWDYCSSSGVDIAHVTITNGLNRPLEVVLRGPTPKTFTINPGAIYILDIEPGEYEYYLTARGYRLKPGTVVFTRGISTWQLY